MTTYRRALTPARWLWTHRRHPRTPVALLGVVSLFSLGARLWYLPKPADANTGISSLIFDEAYYVNAARVILGIHPPTGAAYATALCARCAPPQQARRREWEAA